MSDKISVIIPCYWANENLIEMTMTCINTLIETSWPEECLLVNDGSPLNLELVDETDFDDKIEIIERKKNGGYAAAVNTGLFHATGDILIVSNNDIEFIQPDWLEQILMPLEIGYHVSSIRTTDADGWHTEPKITENDKFGSIWAMKREVYETVGPMDERFGKGLFEDLDYWRRIRDFGFKIGKNHDGIVEHKGKQTFKLVDPMDELFGKNMFTYKQKWGNKAHIIETQPNAILMVDDYELEKHTESEKEELLKKEVSLEEAERRWGVKV